MKFNNRLLNCYIIRPTKKARFKIHGKQTTKKEQAYISHVQLAGIRETAITG